MDGAIRAARARILRSAERMLRIPDAALDREWTWKGARRQVRHGAYRPHEELELAQAQVSSGTCSSQAAALNAKVTAARWALHGVLLPLGELVDVAPGEAWSVRLVLTHLINAHEFWSWQTGHWLEEIAGGRGVPVAGYVRGQVPERLARPPDRVDGTLIELRSILDRHVDAGLDNIAMLERTGSLDSEVKFQGAMVTPRYLPLRWSAHLREHCIQLERTVPGLGRERTEMETIVARTLAAFGELEGALLMFPEGGADRVEPALTAIEQVTVELSGERT